ncbi:transporter substrate-binding domain-containing protein [Salipiger mucosus]|uniref:ABC-type amino acid transport/signal transduction system, periplasmic component/domain protein n=1 Tax=Salipiger mucosus DSM 16094 TaxID=1123237 RepID=S9QJM4_9RHOB|nr:transporter substrate-binding domain-containing protein [Salipiger mucosus]EPX79798.1 ABC-type amino acid transport/signal transduction system, periplasmic component/domain protein [Salipiger mucosus DSM 16094]
MKQIATLVSAIALSAAAAAPGLAQEAAQNDRFMDVMERGVLRVGVQGAFRPWAFRSPDGSLQGIEVDLAQTVADRMGVELEPVVISSSNRMEFLQQGKIDLLIGAMSDRPDRRKVVGIVEPAYWTSGPTLMAKEGVISSWDDIEGKPVCGKQGVFYNRIAEEEFGARVVAFGGNTEAKEALRSGKCVAWVYDDTSIAADLATGDWEGYEMPVDTVFSNPWGAAVPLEEKDGVWGAFLSGMAYNWHKEGTLIELEEKWGVKPSPWLADMNEQLQYDDSYLDN